MEENFMDNFDFEMSEQYMNVKLISNNCISCKRMDIDTIGGEKFKMKPDGNGGLKTVPAGYENQLRCRFYDECKNIFEEGYKVTKIEPEQPSIKIESETFKELMETNKNNDQKTEKKPTTRKSREVTSMSPSAVKAREKEKKAKTTKKATAKK